MSTKNLTIVINCIILFLIVSFFISIILVSRKRERTVLKEQLDFINGYICGIEDKKTNYKVQSTLLFYDEVAKKLYSEKVDKKTKGIVIKYLEYRGHSVPGRRKR